MSSRRLIALWNVTQTTAIGGIFFLLPLVIVGFLVGQLAQACIAVAKALDQYLPFHTVNGYAWLLGLSVVILLLLCFASGLLAKRSIPRRCMQVLEKYLVMVFPRYSIVKDQLSGNIGGKVFQSELKPIMVSLESNVWRLAFEVERSEEQMLTLFLPGSPDPWSGQVVLVHASMVRSLECEFPLAIASMERLGRGLQSQVGSPLLQLLSKTPSPS